MPKSMQQPLPPMEVQSSEQASVGRRTSEQDTAPFQQSEHPGVDESYVRAAELFDEACRGAGLSNKAVGYLLGISESMAGKMRSPDARGCPSFAQLLRLPPSFHLELHKAMSRQYGFGRQALLDLLEAMGRVAMELG